MTPAAVPSADATPSVPPDAPRQFEAIGQVPGIDGPGEELSAFITLALERLNGSVAAFVTSRPGIALVKRRPGAAPPFASLIVSCSHRWLMSWALQQAGPLVLNDSTGAGGLPSCRLLSVRVGTPGGRPFGFLAFFNNATGTPFTAAHVRLAQDLADWAGRILQSQYDPLTGLRSRSAFERHGQVLIRAPVGEVAVAYFDIEGLGRLNERAGLLVGDAVIREVAATLQRNVPRDALTTRLAGDRFAVLLPHCNAVQARETAARVALAVKEIDIGIGRGGPPVSVAYGVCAVSATSAEPLAHALAVAESTRKLTRGSRDPTTLPKHGSVASWPRALLTAADLCAWLKADRFALYAQPVLAIGQQPAVPHFEILLRGLSPDSRALRPGPLLESAAAHGLLPALDRWVIERAFRELPTRPPVGGAGPARWAINLSGPSLQDDTVPDFIERTWQRSAVPAEALCFEISATAVATRPERAIRVMHRLRRLGFGVALDGAGSPALTPLQITALPVSLLKLDAALVRAPAGDREARTALCHLVGLARNLGAQSVAVAVESEDIRRLMISAGVDYGQGFALGQPAPLPTVLPGLAAVNDAVRGGTRSQTRLGFRLFQRY